MFEKYLSDFHQTYSRDVLWDRYECVKFWDQKVTVQGHSGITYAGTITVQAEGIQYSTSHVELDFLVIVAIKCLLSTNFRDLGRHTLREICTKRI